MTKPSTLWSLLPQLSLNNNFLTMMWFPSGQPLHSSEGNVTGRKLHAKTELFVATRFATAHA
jgi:hypothetical protein